MKNEILAYNNAQQGERKALCVLLATELRQALPKADYKLWHGAPVWFINGNPVAGYDALKDSIRLLFWSGQSFDEPALQPEGTFKAAEIRYTSTGQVNIPDVRRWFEKSKTIQWDYKNIVKRRGVLQRLDPSSTG